MRKKEQVSLGCEEVKFGGRRKEESIKKRCREMRKNEMSTKKEKQTSVPSNSHISKKVEVRIRIIRVDKKKIIKFQGGIREKVYEMQLFLVQNPNF